MGIRLAVDDAMNSCRQECFAARARPTGVMAGLKRHHRGATTGIHSRCRKCDHLGMGGARAVVCPLADDAAAGIEDHAAHARIGTVGQDHRHGQVPGTLHGSELSDGGH